MEKDCGTGGTGLGLGTRVPLPPGRITGSASIETLVRVGIEKENGLSPDSKMVIVHDFTPCVDDELQVKRGQVSDFDSQNCSLILCRIMYYKQDTICITHVTISIIHNNSPNFFNPPFTKNYIIGNNVFVKKEGLH